MYISKFSFIIPRMHRPYKMADIYDIKTIQKVRLLLMIPTIREDVACCIAKEVNVTTIAMMAASLCTRALSI